MKGSAKNFDNRRQKLTFLSKNNKKPFCFYRLILLNIIFFLVCYVRGVKLLPFLSSFPNLLPLSFPLIQTNPRRAKLFLSVVLLLSLIRAKSHLPFLLPFSFFLSLFI